MIAVTKHDERLDPAVQKPREIVRSGMHDRRSLGVADQGKLLVRAKNSLRLDAVDDITSTLADAPDDIRAGGVLFKQ